MMVVSGVINKLGGEGRPVYCWSIRSGDEQSGFVEAFGEV
jgi:hypothetical protein